MGDKTNSYERKTKFLLSMRKKYKSYLVVLYRMIQWVTVFVTKT
jgi:hypothetical protein